MKAVGYSVGLVVGGLTLIVVTNTDMPMWLTIFFAATMGAIGALVVEMIEWVKERCDDRETV